MPVLIAAVAVIGALCVLDLLLTFGVIRRLREHTALLTAATTPATPVLGLGVGETPAAVSSLTTSGDFIGDASGLSVVAFFSTSCSICPERVPVFTDYLVRHAVPRERVLAVVCGHESTPAPYVSTLEKVARLTVEPENGELAKAYKVIGFPAFCLLDAQGAVLATDYDPARLPAPVAI